MEKITKVMMEKALNRPAAGSYSLKEIAICYLFFLIKVP